MLLMPTDKPLMFNIKIFCRRGFIFELIFVIIVRIYIKRKNDDVNYIILDMEWNQPSGRECLTINGVRLTGEIIQIGAVKLDEDFVAGDVFMSDVKPVFYRKMNSMVKKITGITESDLSQCLGFEQVMNKFFEFCGKEFSIITWGCDDIPMLIENMTVHGMDFSGLPQSYDLQLIFNRQITRGVRQWSLSSAMEMLNIEQKYTLHNALYDAVNTAKIAMRLDLSQGMENYENIMSLVRLRGQKETAGGFENKSCALRDKTMCRQVCPICGSRLRKGEWIESRGKRISLAQCAEHGTLKFVVTAFKDGDKFAACRRVLPASEEMIAQYSEKLAAAR